MTSADQISSSLSSVRRS